jgi:hypothetical protein
VNRQSGEVSTSTTGDPIQNKAPAGPESAVGSSAPPVGNADPSLPPLPR